MKPTLQLKFSQQLALTPQLQQAIRLLQLSQLELVAELRQVVERNPMLELDENEARDGEPLDIESSLTDPLDKTEFVQLETPAAASSEDVDGTADWDDERIDSTPIDFSSAERVYSQHQPHDYLEPSDAAAESLHEHLRWQLNLSAFTPRETIIGLALIDAIDRRGYLACSLREIWEAIPSAAGVSLDDLESVRRRLQQFDPVGVASLDLQDCLRCQLQLWPATEPLRELSLGIVETHLELLARHDLSQLSKLWQVPSAQIQAAIAGIRRLDPQPGLRYDHAPVEYVAPDVYVYRDQETGWQVSLNPRTQPGLRLNQYYCQLAAEARGQDGQWMRGQLQEARWLLKSLEARSQTLLKVAAAIVGRQRGFLEHGPEAMQPLVLREIADEVEMHESTISRVTSHKYMHTPRGLFEFKHFFSSRLSTDSGDGTSAIAIQALLRKLVDAENPLKPLSDQSLADIFQARGIQLARRTVAKYRDILRIPSSSQRQRGG